MNRILNVTAIFLIAVTAYSATTYENVARAHLSMSGYTETHRIEQTIPVKDGDDVVLYLFKMSPRGFIAVSGLRDMRPILAFSYDTDIDIAHENPGYDYLHKSATTLYRGIMNDDPALINYRIRNRRLWDEYLHNDAFLHQDLLDGAVYGPWLLTNWHQTRPFNRYCPIDPTTGRASMVGCVATSTAKIMNYWDFPYSINFTPDHNYYSGYTEPRIFINAMTANLDTIVYTGPQGFEPDDETKGRLSFAAGVMLQMNYSSSGSGTTTSASRFTDDFGFSNAVQVDRYFTQPVPIDNMVHGRPMYLSLYGTEYGHAVVVDGWRESGEYHMNMGWGGSGDGWYAFLDDDLPREYIAIGRLILDIFAPLHENFPNTKTEAKEIVVGDSLGKVINGLFGDDNDWFKFRAHHDSTYRFYTTGPISTIGDIYDEHGTEYLLRSSSGGTFNNFSLSFRPEYGQSGYYYLRIHGPINYSLVNYKLFYRRLYDDGPYIRLFVPEGGEVLYPSDTLVVTFSLYSIPYGTPVKLEYSVSGRYGPWHEIESSVTGYTFHWTPPTFEEDQTDCYIRAKVDSYPFVLDINDAPFTIRGTASVEETILPLELALSAYPNPFNSAVTIKANSEKIMIYNTKGILIDTVRIDGSTAIWQPADEIETGVYIVKAITGDTVFESTRIVYIR